MNCQVRKKVSWLLPIVALPRLVACSAPDLVAEGEALFTSTDLSPSEFNSYSCETCHDREPTDGLALNKPGAPLAGVTLRPTFYGGQYNDLLDAVNGCRAAYMAAPEPLLATEHDARALYAFLESLEPGRAEAQPFSVVSVPQELPRGDATRGQDSYVRTCLSCHGQIHTGAGRLSDRITLLPEDFVIEHADYTPRVRRIIVVEKVRHGGFYGYGGDMPPFSLEALDDEQLADIIEALDLPE